MIERRRICFTCIQPKSVCNGRRCIVQESVPIGLLCKGCELDAVAKGWAPLNILLCRKKEHAQLRAPWGDIRKDLEKYFGKLSTGSEENSVKVQCNFICNVFTAVKHSDGTEWLNCVEKKPKKYKSTPLINSSTGERIEPDTAIVIPETKEHSFYLMQELKIGNSDCLAFFDSGSNAHLLDGELAERENLQVLSSKPTAISVVG